VQATPPPPLNTQKRTIQKNVDAPAWRMLAPPAEMAPVKLHNFLMMIVISRAALYPPL
jgi:hypothetical protein